MCLCGGTEYSLWRGWGLGLLLLLLNTIFTQGVVYERVSLQEVDTIREDWTRLCVEAQDSGAKLKLQLQVGEPPGRVASNVVVRKKWLPVDEVHTLSVRHYTTGSKKHKMEVFLDEKWLPYDEDMVVALLTPASQWKISMYVKGKVRIEVCAEKSSSVDSSSHPATPILPTTVKMTTTTTPDPTTVVSSIAITTRKASLSLSEGREEWMAPEDHHGMENNDMTDYAPDNTTANGNNTDDVTDSPETGQWWTFLVLGDVGGVPILALLLVCLVLGAVLGAVIALLCARRRKNELHYRRVRRSLPRTADHLDVIINTRSFCSERKNSPDLGSLAGGSRPGISLTPSFTSADLRSNSIQSRLSNMNDLNFSSKNSSNNNSLDSNHLRVANFPNTKHKNALGYTVSDVSNDDNTATSSSNAASAKLNISYPIVDSLYSVPHETGAELLPLKTDMYNKNNYDHVQDKQFGTFRKIR